MLNERNNTNKKKVELKCFSMNEFGQGLAKYGKNVIAISNFLPGEIGYVEVEEFNKITKARVQRIIKPSKSRCEVKCSVYNKCGSCQLLHLNYDEQIKLKKEFVEKCLKDSQINCKIDEAIQADKLTEYRNKMQVAFRMKDNKIIYGFYEEDTHRIVPIEKCIVQTKNQNEVARTIQQIMTSMKIAPYNEDRRSGVIRFALIKESFTSKEVMVVIVTNGEMFPGRNDFVKRLKDKCPFITTIVQNFNSRKTSIILGDEERVLYGKGYIEDYLCGIKFRISSNAFFQINPIQVEKLYNKVKEYADFTNQEVVIDAYCGVGTIGMMLASVSKSVIGVESNKQAVQFASKNAYDNGIKNIKFINADATEFLVKLANNNETIDAIIMDPPRSGSTDAFLNAIIKLKPNKVIYVSCNPITLKRDLKVLVKDYNIVKKCIVDMFVGTYHIESVVLLSLKSPK